MLFMSCDLNVNMMSFWCSSPSSAFGATPGQAEVLHHIQLFPESPRKLENIWFKTLWDCFNSVSKNCWFNKVPSQGLRWTVPSLKMMLILLIEQNSWEFMSQTSHWVNLLVLPCHHVNASRSSLEARCEVWLNYLGRVLIACVCAQDRAHTQLVTTVTETETLRPKNHYDISNEIKLHTSVFLFALGFFSMFLLILYAILRSALFYFDICPYSSCWSTAYFKLYNVFTMSYL